MKAVFLLKEADTGRVLERIARGVCPTFRREAIAEPFAQVVAWIDNPRPKGLLLRGLTGRGKTILMRSLYRYICGHRLVLWDGKHARSDSAFVSARQLAEGWKDNRIAYNNTIQATILFVDDIGAEPEMSNDYGNKLNVVADCMETRSEIPCITFATTNLRRVSDKYDDRVVSRMVGMLQAVNFPGDRDLRTL